MDNIETTRNTEAAIIPKGTVINGNITIEGKLEMYGEVNGDINSDAQVNVSGDITGNIRANEFYAKDSFIVGQIACTQGATVYENTVILGDIAAENLVVYGAIQGKIDVRESITVGDKAILDSDIRARTIQVNNGATINGHCSLCDTDNKLKDVFPVTEKVEEVVMEQEPSKEEKPRAVVKPRAAAIAKVVKKADTE
ncbi:MAG: polymer-forming cytoskeletal protein [Lachnospiraceae bacterium]|nr:polymer-forming cytoskeletal protein [Lachnospiraceae bacterium]MDE7275040.1 polymer-forming cytoskeletal protein [Lachnospiraceae bacterium]